MRRGSILLGVFLAAWAIANPARAQNYRWCANFHDGAGVNCGFSTYQQCMATAQGSGGFCTQNNAYTPPAAATPSRQSALKHHRRKAL